jgi:hypothetical protein
MNRGRVVQERGGKETNRCPLTVDSPDVINFQPPPLVP